MFTLYVTSSQLRDESGNGHHGYSRGLVGAMRRNLDMLAPGGVRGAEFLGVNTTDYAAVDPFDAWPPDDFTTECWLSTRSGGPYQFGFKGNNEYLLNPHTSGVTVFVGAAAVSMSGGSLVDGALHHVVIRRTRSSGLAEFFRDGVLVATGTVSSGHTMATSGFLCFGQEQDSEGGGFDASQAWRGYFGEAAVYSGHLSNARILAHYNAGITSGSDYRAEVLADAPVGYWRLYDVNGLVLQPTPDLEDSGEKIINRHRTRAGDEYRYTWGSFRRWSFPVEHVSSSFAQIVNSWWGANSDLLLKAGSETAVHSVHIVNRRRPIGRYIEPLTDHFRGTIELETY